MSRSSKRETHASAAVATPPQPQPTSTARERLNLSLTEIKPGAEEGTFSGLASVYGSVAYGARGPTTFARGAFTETLQKSGGKVPLLWQHKDEGVIGTAILKDGPQGLEVSGKISKTSLGLDARELLKDGALDGVSIGFHALETGKPVKIGEVSCRQVTKADVEETSIVTFPADKKARVISVHSRGEEVSSAIISLLVDRAETHEGRMFSGVNLANLHASWLALTELIAKGDPSFLSYALSELSMDQQGDSPTGTDKPDFKGGKTEGPGEEIEHDDDQDDDAGGVIIPKDVPLAAKTDEAVFFVGQDWLSALTTREAHDIGSGTVMGGPFGPGGVDGSYGPDGGATIGNPPIGDAISNSEPSLNRIKGHLAKAKKKGKMKPNAPVPVPTDLDSHGAAALREAEIQAALLDCDVTLMQVEAFEAGADVPTLEAFAAGDQEQNTLDQYTFHFQKPGSDTTHKEGATGKTPDHAFSKVCGNHPDKKCTGATKLDPDENAPVRIALSPTMKAHGPTPSEMNSSTPRLDAFRREVLGLSFEPRTGEVSAGQAMADVEAGGSQDPRQHPSYPAHCANCKGMSGDELSDELSGAQKAAKAAHAHADKAAIASSHARANGKHNDAWKMQDTATTHRAAAQDHDARAAAARDTIAAKDGKLSADVAREIASVTNGAVEILKVLSSKLENDLEDSKFAFVKTLPDGSKQRKLPIHDAAHVRNALARFNQTQGMSADEKKSALGKIHAAAKKMGVEVSDS